MSLSPTSEALDAFQLCTKLEGIIPALEPAHALAFVEKLAPTLTQGSSAGDEYVRARRQGCVRSGRLSGGRAVIETRIDRRFAALKSEGRAAFVAFITAGDPDLETSLELMKKLPESGADVIELGMPFSDPDGRWSGGAIFVATGLESRTDHEPDPANGTHLPRRPIDETPIILMGYYNPIYVYPADKFLSDAGRGRC